MKHLYDKSALGYALACIGVYVLAMNIGLQLAGGLDDLAGKTIVQLLVPVGIGLVLSVTLTAFILRYNLGKTVGLCHFRGNWRGFLFFVPVVVMSLVNMKNGLAAPAALPLCLLMALNMAVAGYLEELIFRGFLFRAMAKDNVRSAVIVSAVTFGAGHIVNLMNTADTLSVLLQVGYAIVIGFMYTAIVYRGGSLWPCIFSHMLVNFTSVFAKMDGPFTNFVQMLTGRGNAAAVEIAGAVLVVLLSGSYALWLWRGAPFVQEA